jgi:alpha-L-fucosidase
MFPETWSWRSWQERGEVDDKVAQKIGSLAEVVSRGGNYLLNIGPCADGSVVPFEREVLNRIGAWLEVNGDAVYGTSPSPFRETCDWGCVTVKDNHMYLILTGKCPEDLEIVLPVRGYRLKQCQTPGVRCRSLAGSLVISVYEELYSNPSSPKVIRLTFDRSVQPFNALEPVERSKVLSWDNATPDYSYSCFDYYSNYRSMVGYNWLISGKGKVSKIEVLYTENEVGREIELMVGGSPVKVKLDGDQFAELPLEASVSNQRIARIRGGVFDGPPSWENFDLQSFNGDEPKEDTFTSRQFSNYLLTSTVEMNEAGYALFDIASGNGVEVIVNGKTMLKHLNPYRSVCHKEKVLLYLPQGHSDVMLRSYNRFEKTASARLVPDPDGSVYRMTVSLPAAVPADRLMVKLSSADSESLHSDCLLHNIRLILK